MRSGFGPRLGVGVGVNEVVRRCLVGDPLDEHAPAGAAGFVDGVDLERNRSSTQRVELCARMGPKEDCVARQHVVHRHDEGHVVAIDDGQTPDSVLSGLGRGPSRRTVRRPTARRHGSQQQYAEHEHRIQAEQQQPARTPDHLRTPTHRDGNDQRQQHRDPRAPQQIRVLDT